MSKFGLIYADPAWTFDTYSDEGKDRSPEQHYDCMTVDEIAAMPVADVAAGDSVVMCWACDPLLDKVFYVLKKWGFDYKTVGLYYVKVGVGMRPHTGMGYWTRANPEICVLGTRGKPKRQGKDVARLILEMTPDDKVLFAARGEHSAKPLEAYNRIERLVDGPYLELFARHARPGWSQWGNEVGKTGGIPNLVSLPGLPARAAANSNSLFGDDNAA